MTTTAETASAKPLLALLTSAELPAIDRHMDETGTSHYELMERAGAAVAREVGSFAPKARRIVVLAGPNNNGGDCICAARLLSESGRDVTVALFAERSQLPPTPAKAAANWHGPTVFATPQALAGADLIVDGLYGGGLKQDIEGDAAALVAAVNAGQARVLAVDFPSGVSGSTGAILGSAVKADRTISFLCLKPGHLLMPGRAQCGPIVIDSIGIPASVMDVARPRAFHNRPDLWSRSTSGADKGEVKVFDGKAFAAAFAGLSNPSMLERVRDAAKQTGSVIAYLGIDRVVAAPDERGAIADNAPPEPAPAGTVDAVAAVIRDLRKRGMPSFEAAAAGVWLLGEAGGPHPDRLAQAMRKISG